MIGLVTTLNPLPGIAKPRAPDAPRLHEVALPRGVILTRTLAGDPQQKYYLYIPRHLMPRSRLFVTVHGISRNAAEHAKAFAPLAERYGVVLVAPLFPASRFPDYQRLGRHGERADHVLDQIVAEVALLTHARVKKLYLFGYSGGGQFVHRYAMAYPKRVARYVVGAAGWYTLPDPALKFPLGLRKSREFLGVRLSPDKFLKVPACVLVGEDDVHRHRPLKQSARVDDYQGANRVDRGALWAAAMTEAARDRGLDTQYCFDTYPRTAHSFARSVKRGNIHQRVFEYLFGPPPSAPAEAAQHIVRVSEST